VRLAEPQEDLKVPLTCPAGRCCLVLLPLQVELEDLLSAASVMVVTVTATTTAGVWGVCLVYVGVWVCGCVGNYAL